MLTDLIVKSGSEDGKTSYGSVRMIYARYLLVTILSWFYHYGMVSYVIYNKCGVIFF